MSETRLWTRERCSRSRFLSLGPDPLISRSKRTTERSLVMTGSNLCHTMTMSYCRSKVREGPTKINLSVYSVASGLSMKKQSGNIDTMNFPFSDADPDDTGNYKIEVSNDSGTAACAFGVKVKGERACGGHFEDLPWRVERKWHWVRFRKIFEGVKLWTVTGILQPFSHPWEANRPSRCLWHNKEHLQAEVEATKGWWRFQGDSLLGGEEGSWQAILDNGVFTLQGGVPRRCVKSEAGMG